MTSKSQKYENTKNAEARFMTSEKKRYYLASINEDEQTLINNQKEELTTILIELKSEYDKISRENKRKNQEIEDLEKKSKMLEEQETKNQKKFKEINDTNEVMKEAIDLKRKKKDEELYQKKTLTKQIENLKTDILLIQKDIVMQENQSKKLEKEYNKQRLQENEIREKKNSKYSQISEQNSKNNYEKNENDLQIKYYQKIITQKNKFLQAADERKEKQALIAKNAKNDALDKTEVEMRKNLALIKLYNQYLRQKMNDQLKENEEMENVFRQVRDISGTTNMRQIVDFVLNKDRRYNMFCKLAQEKENEKEVLAKDIEELENQLTALKNEFLIKPEGETNKTIETIPIQTLEEEDIRLMAEQKELKKELYKLQTKQKDILITYNNVIDNINDMLTNEGYEETDEDLNQQAETNQTNVEVTENKEENAEEGEEKDEFGEEVGVEKEEENKKEENNNNEEENREEEENNNEEEENKNEQEEGQEKPVEEGQEKVAEEGEDKKNLETTEGNQETKVETEQQQEQLEIPEQTEEEKEIIRKYSNFLKRTENTFNELFLCHSKLEFINLMREKGIDSQRGERQAIRKRTVANIGKRNKTYKTEGNVPLARINEFDEVIDLKDQAEENNFDRKLIKEFLDELKRQREDEYKDKNKTGKK